MVATSSAYLLGTVLGTFFVPPLTVAMKLGTFVRLLAIIMTLGSFSRLYIDSTLIFTLIGQFLIGVSASFTGSEQIQLCASWFAPKNRPLFISLLIIMGTVGVGIGNVIPTLFVDNDETDVSKLASQFNKYNWYMFAISSGLLGLTLFLFRGKPPKGYGYANKRTSVEFA